MSSTIRPPLPPLKPNNFIQFTFNNGKSITSKNVEVVKELIEVFKSAPNIEKKNAYFILGKSIVFLENVDSIQWNLVEEETE